MRKKIRLLPPWQKTGSTIQAWEKGGHKSDLQENANKVKNFFAHPTRPVGQKNVSSAS